MKSTKPTAAQPSTTNPLANPVHARIASLDSIVVGHDAVKAAIAGIADCISWSNVSSEPRGAVLVGIGGTGKTTICSAICNRFPPGEIVEEHMVIKTVPAFYSSIPSPSTIKSVAANLLEGLGALSPRYGTAISLTARLCDLLKISRTKIILLDEFHHLLSASSQGDARAIQVCNWIKALINQTGVMVCLVGTPECEALVNCDSQLSRRFTHRFRLSELGGGTQAEPGPLRKFLLAMTKQYVERLGLDGFVDFHDHLNVSRIWAATSGNPAFVTLLMKEATAIALSAKRTTVVIGDFFEAYQKGITLAVSKTSGNPFGMTKLDLASSISSINLK